MNIADRLLARLCEPFATLDVHWTSSVVSGNRALAVASVEASVIVDRLNAVLGASRWTNEYSEAGAHDAMLCKLSLDLGDGQWVEKWVSKMDIADGGNGPECQRRQVACDLALVHAAAKFGIGRYLQRLPAQWCDYDPARRTFVRAPVLPEVYRREGIQS